MDLPLTNNSTELDPASVASTWLSDLSSSFEKGDIDSLVVLFLPDGWFRDFLTFTWDLRTRHGRHQIKSYLNDVSQDKLPGKIAIDTRHDFHPCLFNAPGLFSGIEFAFAFETSVALGRGYARIVPDPQDRESWKALTVMMMADNWKGHEELPYESGIYEGHNLSWQEVRKERRAEIEKDPLVLIVGAGQAGLQQAARNRQLGLKTLVIEKDARIGDVWRKRYPTLALHTTRKHHSLLYQPFPSNWPIYTPKNRIAFWFE